MKKQKYTYKNKIPKTLKRKNTHQANWAKQKQPPRIKQLLNKTSIERNKQPKMVNNSSSTWRLPTIIFTLTLMMIILVIPTVIVVPFSAKDEQNASIEDNKQTEQQLDLDLDQSLSLNIPVMRTNSEEIENVPLETYVARVVASEMPVEFELEALKAQGIATRTYVVNHLIHQENSEQSEITDTTDHQVYKNEEELRKQYGSDYTWKMDKLVEAVKATEGMILTYKDEPITPAFFSTSNGYTENSEDYWENELPYLRSVESPWDKESPQFLDQQTFTIDTVNDILNIELPSSISLPIKIARTDSGRVSELEIANYTFTGREIRDKLQLKSNDFVIEQKNSHLIFTTKGFGHGIGMSQYGANGLAKEGKSYEEIVKYYYKDIELSEIKETAPTILARE